MTSTFTANLNLELPAGGDYPGTWNVPVNADFTAIDGAFGGTTSLNATGASGTTVLSTSQYPKRFIVITGTLTANVTYQFPASVAGFWFVTNSTTGNFTVTLSSAGGGTTLALQQGYTTIAKCDATNVSNANTNPLVTILLASAGSAGAASYAFSGDADTGFYSPGAGSVAATADGVRALFVGTSSATNSNVILGRSGGSGLTSGASNTLIGASAGTAITTGSNNSCIGANAAPTSASVSNEFTLGDASITTLRCAATTITALSDARDKTGITDLGVGLALIEALRPVRFVWNSRDRSKIGIADTGFIAQEVGAALVETGADIPGLVYDENPDRIELSAGKLLPVVIRGMQELLDANRRMSARIETLEAQTS